MAMTYASLTGAKGQPGAIATWVNYTKLDIGATVDEAQALIYSLLRCREMRTHMSFNMPVGGSSIALPAGFLDPIGRIYATSYNLTIAHKDENFVQRNRNFTETSGSLGNNALTATNGSTQVSVNLPGHGFNQGSVFNLSGATAVGGITPNGTFDIVAVTDANDFVIDTLTLTATSSAVGGGSGMAYLCDNLVAGTPSWWGIWDEQIWFDTALTQTLNMQLQYFRSLPLLSAANQTNFLTNRYPQLMRAACMTAAADFMKDDGEYQKGLAKLGALIAAIGAENDMLYRGAEIDAETP
ncbi:MAG: hypothetical protein ACLPKB_24710 [Xanthobacteraceae bacterium]